MMTEELEHTLDTGENRKSDVGYPLKSTEPQKTSAGKEMEWHEGASLQAAKGVHEPDLWG